MAVGLGAFLALMSVTVIALLVGRKLRSRVPAHLIQRGAAAVFGVFALLAAGAGGLLAAFARRAVARSPVVLTMATRKSARCSRVTSTSPRSQLAKTSIVPLTRVSAPSSRSGSGAAWSPSSSAAWSATMRDSVRSISVRRPRSAACGSNMRWPRRGSAVKKSITASTTPRIRSSGRVAAMARCSVRSASAAMSSRVASSRASRSAKLS